MTPGRGGGEAARDQAVEPVFAALADGTRRRVLRVLADGGPASATQLAAAFPVSRQAVTKHLQVLAEAGLVAPSRHGRETRWQVTPEPLEPAMAWMAEVGSRWDVRLDALRRHLAEPDQRRIGFRPGQAAARRGDPPTA